MTHISKTVRTVIKESLCLNELPVDGDTLDQLGADSLDAVDIAMGLEEAFDIDIDQESMVNAESIGDIVHIVADTLAYSSNS